MIAICEECGNKYRIDTNMIQGTKAKFQCAACNHIIVVAKPLAIVPDVQELPDYVGETDATAAAESGFQEQVAKKEPWAETVTEEESLETQSEPAKRKSRKPKKKARFGLRPKMMLLFFIIPNLIIIAAGILYMRQIGNLANLITSKSTIIVANFTEQIIENKGRSVAAQLKLYLDSHPDRRDFTFNDDPGFQKLASQPVGKTGYTVLYSISDDDSKWNMWAHPNPKLFGVPTGALKKPLGENFEGLWNIITKVKGGKVARGYYNWRETDGQLRAKYMVSIPVEGYPYAIASTTYIDEFEKEVRQLKVNSGEIASRTRLYVLIILVSSLIMIGLVVSLYATRLAGKIQRLTEFTERISVGELDSEIEVKSNDEIGDLVAAISRMQVSIRLSIERLRQHRRRR
jgi:HAMP domain-containing protein